MHERIEKRVKQIRIGTLLRAVVIRMPYASRERKKEEEEEEKLILWYITFYNFARSKYFYFYVITAA